MVRANPQIDACQIPEALSASPPHASSVRASAKFGNDQDASRRSSRTTTAGATSQLEHFV
jgi:hypothetical protein